MKKFKHRKTGEIATYKDGILKSSGFAIEIGVEPSKEFWELIVEKDYEILSLIEDEFIYPCDKYNKDYINQLFNTLGVSIHSR